MRVGDIEAGDGGRISLNRIFGDRVINGLTGLVLGHAGEAVGPSVGFRHLLLGDLLSIGKKVHGDALRTHAVLIVGIVPRLGT